MKNLLVVTSMLISVFCFSQTTMTEYNYLTKGYKLDLETGRDIKSGYILTPYLGNGVSINDGTDSIERTLTVLKFIKMDENRTVALLVVEKKKTLTT